MEPEISDEQLMKWKAVIFDFFGTLVGNFPIQEHNGVLSKMAGILSVPEDDFARMWVETFPDRATGAIPTLKANIEYICRALGRSVTSVQMTAASDIRLHFYRRRVRPRPGVLEALAHLKAEDYKIGLITDCSSELPKLWSSTPFASLIDVAVFSCYVRVRKPDPRIYRLACKRLGVVPQDCLYVGDGSSRELTGSSAVGMQPLLIRSARALVFGHTHRPFVSPTQNLVNTGSWVSDEATYNTYVELDGKNIHLMQYGQGDITQKMIRTV